MAPASTPRPIADRPGLPLAITGAIAAAVAGYAWYRTLTFERITGPHTVAWRDADGALVDTRSIGASMGDPMMNNPLVLGDRLIVMTAGPERDPERGGFAWISPSTGQARIAWPLGWKYRPSIEGVAIRDLDTFALMVHTERDHEGGVRDAYVVGIAGRDGWIRPPVTLAEWSEQAPPGWSRQPLLLAMSWMNGELEVVLTHPGETDPWGSRSPPDIIRIGATGAPVVRSHPLGCEDCSVYGALPGPKGWTMVVRTHGDRVLLSDGTGPAVPAPPALAWWDQTHSDRAALGTLWAASGYGERRVERDGTMSDPVSPVPGWTAIVIAERLVWKGDVLRMERLWGRDRSDISTLAHHVGDRTIFVSTVAEDLQLIGPSPEALRPAIFGSSSSDFRVGVFLPRRGGGYHWVDGKGNHVTIDDQLRRIDPLPLRRHLRTRGSVGDFIDEPEHERYLGWALFGLPILALVGLVAALIARRPRRLTVALGAYAVTGGWALLKVLPLL